MSIIEKALFHVIMRFQSLSPFSAHNHVTGTLTWREECLRQPTACRLANRSWNWFWLLQTCFFWRLCQEEMVCLSFIGLLMICHWSILFTFCAATRVIFWKQYNEQVPFGEHPSVPSPLLLRGRKSQVGVALSMLRGGQISSFKVSLVYWVNFRIASKRRKPFTPLPLHTHPHPPQSRGRSIDRSPDVACPRDFSSRLFQTFGQLSVCLLFTLWVALEVRSGSVLFSVLCLATLCLCLYLNN